MARTGHPSVIADVPAVVGTFGHIRALPRRPVRVQVWAMDDRVSNEILSRLHETTKATPNPHLRGWTRFQQLWPDVLELLRRGYAIRDVHVALVEDGHWSGGYDAFRRHVTRARRTSASTEKEEPPSNRRNGGGTPRLDEFAHEAALTRKVRGHLKNAPRHRADFLEARPTIQRLLADGYSGKAIHSALVEAGAISCAYRTWCRLLTDYIDGP